VCLSASVVSGARSRQLCVQARRLFACASISQCFTGNRPFSLSSGPAFFPCTPAKACLHPSFADPRAIRGARRGACRPCKPEPAAVPLLPSRPTLRTSPRSPFFTLQAAITCHEQIVAVAATLCKTEQGEAARQAAGASSRGLAWQGATAKRSEGCTTEEGVEKTAGARGLDQRRRIGSAAGHESRQDECAEWDRAVQWVRRRGAGGRLWGLGRRINFVWMMVQPTAGWGREARQG